MKKALILLLLLLPVWAGAEMRMEADSRLLALGDELAVQVSDAPEETCSYTLMKGKKTVFEGEGVPYFGGRIRPREVGEYTLRVSSGGEEATLEFTVTEAGAPFAPEAAVAGPFYVDGNQGAAMRPGDVRAWMVYAPGPWTAEADESFLLLSKDCGANGDELFVTILPTGVQREGNIIFRCGEQTLTVPLLQTAYHAAEEEVSFEAVEDFIRIDGEMIDTCFLEEEAFFSVESSGAWTAETDADFLTVTVNGDQLILRREVNAEDVQEGCVTLTCGMENAYLYVFCLPHEKGADVKGVTVMNGDVQAWQEDVEAQVLTSPDAERLTVSMQGYEEVFSARDFATETEEGLLWRVFVPVQQGGEQLLFFRAENKDGSGGGMKTTVNVLPEEAAFISEEATLISAGDYHHLKFVTTAQMDHVQLMDGRGQVLAAYEGKDVSRSFAGPKGQKERYIAWDIPMEAGVMPSLVQAGQMRIPVSLQGILTPGDIELYSQTDGWWQDKKYSISNLEQSGCAVFSLSHALQLLGYTGEDIRPEKLAKTYAAALMRDGSGTMNSTLVGRAGDDFGFKTRYELYENPTVIREKAREGAVFSFSVVNGHIACVACVLEEEEKCLIIDSAPSATFERKGDVPVYYPDEDGHFTIAASPADLPGAVYYPETNSFGCCVYYMDLSYVAKRGVRLIQPK